MPFAARRVSGAPGRWHIEVRGLHRPGTRAAARAVESALVALAGVDRAEVNCALGRVTVWHDHAVVSRADLVRVVVEAEAEQGLADQEPASGSTRHPGDPWQWARHGVRLGAALIGAGYAVGTRLLPVRAIPAAVPAVAALIDHTPVLRELAESRLGCRLTELLLEVANKGGSVLAQQPANLLIDAVAHWLQLREARARYLVWQQWDQTLSGRASGHRADPVAPPPPRIAPFPDGPVERIANRVGPLALASTAVLVFPMRSPQRALGVLRAGVTRAGRLGREAFAAQLGASLAGRRVLELDPRALRRLDRVSCVVIDAGVLITPRRVVDQVLALDEQDVTAADLTVRVHELLDLADPAVPQQRGGWSVAPLDGAQTALPPEIAAAVTVGRRTGALAVGLHRKDRLVGVATVVSELDPLAEALVAAARQACSVVMAAAGTATGLGERLAVTQVVPGGLRLRRSIQQLQADGHAVVLVSASGRAALAVADVGIGIAGRTPTAPWEADLLTGPDLAGACTVLQAVPLAGRVSRRSAQLALGGSVLGGLLAAVGPAAGASGRAIMPVHGMALFSLASATWYATEAQRIPVPVPVHRVPWHAMPAGAVLDELGSSLRGLDPLEAQRRDGRRPAEPVEEDGGLGRAVLEELASPITPALTAGAGVSAGIGAVVDAVMIGGALGISALLGGVQQVGAQRALRTLGRRSMVPVTVRRGEQVISADPAGLVPGDVLELEAGDAVPADGRVLTAEGLEVDESALTGESQLVSKIVDATPQLAVADRRCMVYQGTVIAAGSAVAVVVAAGADTEIGRTARADGAKAPATGVQRRLQSLTKVTLRLSLAAGVALLGADLLRGHAAGQALGRAVSLAVAAVPEGLPFVATVAELAAARRLSGRGALVRNSSTIEALGRVDTLCFDKTGTLTAGHIALRRISDGETDCLLTELDRRYRTVVAAALRATPGVNSHGSLPHPTDQAVVDGAAEVAVDPGEGAPEWVRVEELHFEPSRGYHAVLGRCRAGQRLSVKGAPEVVLERCTRWVRPGETGEVDGDVDGEVEREFDGAARRTVDAEANRLARQGYRLLAVAERDASDRRDLDDERVGQLRLVGLLALADPVRPTAAQAVRQLQGAGVTVVMITGDHPSTAEAIAAELDALGGRRILTGPELDALGDEQLAEVLPQVAVFARASPEQKARIVRGLQESGRVVAVTGDGANDAPAIRLADVGIALGGGATPAARDAADLVITDDAIETITDAVVEGRGMWASVREAVALLLGGNLGEIIFTVGTGVLGAGDALNARQLLLVNLLTDALPAMAIAVRPPPGRSAEALLAEGPDTSLGSALIHQVYLRAATTAGGAGLAWLAGRMLTGRGQVSTVALVALVATQLGQTMVVRGRTPLVLGAGVASLAALTAIVQTPGVSQLFGCRPLTPHSWAIALTSATLATAAGLVAGRLLPSAEQGKPAVTGW
ncbi:MAG: HAD-IC family P-type ATPase [Pseudonocardiaceae bacterium]